MQAANAVVTPVGVDTTAGPNWRTAAALESDRQYGTSGYVIFGLNANNSVYTQPFDISSGNSANAYSLPAGVDITTEDTNIGMWSGNDNFGNMQHPVGGALTPAPVLANSGGTRQFTITRSTAAAWRLTFLTASGDNEGTEYTLTVDDGSGPKTSVWDHVANGLAYHVFDISSGTAPIVVEIASAAQNRSLTGIAFDPVSAVVAPPGFASHPSPVALVQGGPGKVSFSVTTSGAGVTLQWQRNGNNIPGATADTYTLTAGAADNGAVFRCVAKNGGGTATSDPATLSLVAVAPRTTDYRAAVDEPSRLAFFPFDGDTGTTVTNKENAPAGGTVNMGELTALSSRVVGTTALAGSAILEPDPAWEFSDDNTGTVEAFIYQSGTAAYNPCIFSIRAGTTRISLHADAAGNKLYFWNGAVVGIWDTPVNTIGRRTHVAFVFEADNVTVYMDGVSLGTKAIALGAASGLPAQIGASSDNGAELFPGTIDELAIYKDALSASRISLHSAGWYGAAPEIITQPKPGSVVQGAHANFTVSARGPDLTYQWKRGNSNIPGATAATLQIITAASDNGAIFRCVVSNASGSLTSDPATLTLAPPAPQSAAYRAAITAEAGLIAFFPFDGDAGPAITNTRSAANGGTVRSNSFLTGASGQVVGTTGLSGSAGLTAPSGTPDNPFPWEFPSGTGSVEAVLYQSAAAGYNPCFFAIRDSSATRYSLHGATDGSKLFLWNGAAVTIWDTPKNMIGRQSHVVISFDNGSVTAWFDGASLGTKENGLGAGTGISTQIGSSTETSAELWPGTIDEVALYDRALPANVVNAHASAWLGALPAPVISQARVSSGNIFLTVITQTGLTYGIETSPELNTSWIGVGDAVAGTGGELFLSAPIQGKAGFYRVRATR